MNLEITKIPKTDCIYIPVASQLIKGKLTSLSCKGVVYDIIETLTYKRNDYIPRHFLRLVMGEYINADKIWSAYPKSEALVIYACTPRKEEKKEEKKETEGGVPELD